MGNGRFSALAAFVASAVLAACGDDSAGPSPDAATVPFADGSADANPANMPDASLGSASDAGVAAFCANITAYYSRCPSSDACTQAEVQYCATWSPSFSDGYRAATGACVAGAPPCVDGGANPILSSCLIDHLPAPTAAQAQVAADFCSRCPDGTSATLPNACTQFFSSKLNDAGNPTGFGIFVWLASDGLASTLDQQCVAPLGDAGDAGATDCAATFDRCALEAFLTEANLPAACTDVSF